MTRILVLCAIDPAEPMQRCVGQSRFLGEAGLALADRGVELICAAPGADEGYRPVPGAWEPTAITDIDAVYDRSHRRPRHVQQTWERRGVAVFNPVSFSDLCDDKLVFARLARDRGLPVPRTAPATDPEWQGWEGAFVKPRFGARGRGVRPVRPGETLDRGVVQEGVRSAVHGQSTRILLQRAADGTWNTAGIMVRRARDHSAVVSLATGASAEPANAEGTAEMRPLVAATADVLDTLADADRIVEVGLDVVVDHRGPWLLEWNARPGRSFDRMGRPDLRDEAVIRPFERMLEGLRGG